MPDLGSISKTYKAKSPSYFAYDSDSKFWMGLTRGKAELKKKYLNTKYTKRKRGWMTTLIKKEGDKSPS